MNLELKLPWCLVNVRDLQVLLFEYLHKKTVKCLTFPKILRLYIYASCEFVWRFITRCMIYIEFTRPKTNYVKRKKLIGKQIHCKVKQIHCKVCRNKVYVILAGSRIASVEVIEQKVEEWSEQNFGTNDTKNYSFASMKQQRKTRRLMFLIGN